MNYWINTISRNHVERGVAGGFTQAGHGKPTGLKRLKAGDWMVFYSPKTDYEGGEPLQAFTAIGQVKDDELYQFEMMPGFMPWRRNVDFKPCIETPIKPLIGDLSFIKDKTHWGYMFRFGLFQIPEPDFELIKNAMQTTAQDKLETFWTDINGKVKGSLADISIKQAARLVLMGLPHDL